MRMINKKTLCLLLICFLSCSCSITKSNVISNNPISNDLPSGQLVQHRNIYSSVFEMNEDNNYLNTVNFETEFDARQLTIPSTISSTYYIDGICYCVLSNDDHVRHHSESERCPFLYYRKLSVQYSFDDADIFVHYKERQQSLSTPFAYSKINNCEYCIRDHDNKEILTFSITVESDSYVQSVFDAVTVAYS